MLRRLLAVGTVMFVAVAMVACDERPTSFNEGFDGATPELSMTETLTFGSATTIDFESTGLATGASVEGFGTLHSHLNLVSTASGTGVDKTDAVLVEEGTNPRAYTAGGTNNGCLANPGGSANSTSGARGFSDTEATIDAPRIPHAYELEFAENSSVEDFSVLMLDHGDFLEDGDFPISVTLTAFDVNGDVVDTHVETVESRTGAGDACGIDSGDPGVATMAVSGSGITRLTLEQSSDGWDAGVGFDDITFTLSEVPIDIKPGSDPNCFNSDGNGVIPVAILSNEWFDATEVDPSTVTLEGSEVAVRGNGNKTLASEEDVNDDGLTDLALKIEDEDAFTEGSGTATLTGSTFDGTSFEGSDSICITQ